MKIGTAAPTPDQLKRVPHYFVGTLELTDYYSAAQFEAEVLKKLEELFRTHPVVVMTGGSMMYVDAVCKGIDDIPTVDKETRELMLRRYESEGLEQLCAELRVLDPEYYRIVDLKNPKRVIHALEICYMTGKPTLHSAPATPKNVRFKSSKLASHATVKSFTSALISAWMNDERRIAGGSQKRIRLQAPQFTQYRRLQGDIQLPEWRMGAPLCNRKNQAKLTHLFPKQMTWFKRDPEITWFHPTQAEEIMKFLEERINQA